MRWVYLIMYFDNVVQSSLLIDIKDTTPIYITYPVLFIPPSLVLQLIILNKCAQLAPDMIL